MAIERDAQGNVVVVVPFGGNSRLRRIQAGRQGKDIGLSAEARQLETLGRELHAIVEVAMVTEPARILPFRARGTRVGWKPEA